MASRIQSQKLIPALVPALCAAVLGGLPVDSASAHQLSNANGNLVPHQHVYRRVNYGSGYITGHVVPTRHGHNMIIWSPTPGNAYGNAVPRMHITKPERRSRVHSQRPAQNLNQELRKLNRRDGRR